MLRCGLWGLCLAGMLAMGYWDLGAAVPRVGERLTEADLSIKVGIGCPKVTEQTKATAQKCGRIGTTCQPEIATVQEVKNYTIKIAGVEYTDSYTIQVGQETGCTAGTDKTACNAQDDYSVTGTAQVKKKYPSKNCGTYTDCPCHFGPSWNISVIPPRISQAPKCKKAGSDYCTNNNACPDGANTTYTDEKGCGLFG